MLKSGINTKKAGGPTAASSSVNGDAPRVCASHTFDYDSRIDKWFQGNGDAPEATVDDPVRASEAAPVEATA